MLRIHVAFILGKRTLLILSLSMIGLVTLFAYYADVLENYEVLDVDRTFNLSMYVCDCVSLLEFALVMLGIAIASSAYSETASAYLIYLVCNRKTKLSAILSKALAVLMIELAFVWLILIFFYLIPRFFTPYSLNFIDSTSLFSFLFEEMLFYTFLHSLGMIVFRNHLSLVLPLLLFFIVNQADSLAQIDQSRLLGIANMIIPNLILCPDGYTGYGNQLLYSLTLIMLVIAATLLHLRSDI